MLQIWLDCDPGHDDMLAIIMATMNEKIQVLGISTSAGNSNSDNTTQNALNILGEINKTQIVVIQGAKDPLLNQLNDATDIHGESGLDGIQLKRSEKQAIKKNPILEIYNRINEQKEPINFVVTGPMTNLALLLKSFPQIKQKIKTITIMGGAIGIGNWNPAAQFNIIVDPQAASIVFHSGIKVTMVPLEVTHTVLINQQIFNQLSQMKSQFAQKLIPLFRFFQLAYKKNQNFDFPVAHDPCTIYYLLHPEDFKGKDAHVSIQLEGKSRGRTNCQFMHYKVCNAFVCTDVNVENFWKQMLECIRKIQ